MSQRLLDEDWGYQHKTVCHARGEYARDEDGDGFCEGHVNTMEGFWSLLRSWLRPHRGISQDKLPLYLGFFQVVHTGRPQRAPAWESPAQRPCRRPGCVSQPHHPGTRQEPLPLSMKGEWRCQPRNGLSTFQPSRI